MGRSLGAQGGQGVAAFYSFSLEMNIFKMRAAGPGPRTPGPAARILKMFISVSAQPSDILCVYLWDLLIPFILPICPIYPIYPIYPCICSPP